MHFPEIFLIIRLREDPPVSNCGRRKTGEIDMVLNRVHFEGMDEEAFDVITAITGSRELEQVKEQYREEGGRINMCEAIRGMIEDGRMEGKLEGKYEGALEKTRAVARNMYLRGMSAEDAAAICEMDTAQIEVWFREWGKR